VRLQNYLKGYYAKLFTKSSSHLGKTDLIISTTSPNIYVHPCYLELRFLINNMKGKSSGSACIISRPHESSAVGTRLSLSKLSTAKGTNLLCKIRARIMPLKVPATSVNGFESGANRFEVLESSSVVKLSPHIKGVRLSINQCK
jgi:hypothetical protein